MERARKDRERNKIRVDAYHKVSYPSQAWSIIQARQRFRRSAQLLNGGNVRLGKRV